MNAQATNQIDVMTMQAVYSIIDKAEENIFSFLGRKIRLIPHAEDMKTDDVASVVKKDLLIRSIVSSVTGFEWSKIASKKRSRELVNARFVYCYIIRQEIPSITLKAIGESIGGRDHTTTIHALQSMKDLIDTKDQTILSLLFLINQKLKEYESKAQS